ncbi:MAG: efflux RND transporter periplasmic adaptor subunit [Bacteroidota bacterium]
MKKHLTSTLPIVAIVLSGLAVTALLFAFSPVPPRETPPDRTPLVQVATFTAHAGSIPVTGTGTVHPTREIQLSAEVGGRLVSVSPALVTGGALRAGEIVATVDPSDYENAVAVAEAQVTLRQFEVLQAQEEVQVAQAEWTRLGTLTGQDAAPDSTALGRLAFREPQLRLAEANLRSAEAQLDDAQVRLARTQIKAPFSGRVRTKHVDLGQYVGPGQAVASVYATDEAEVIVPLSGREAALIEGLWTPGASARRMPATVSTGAAMWDGYVHRVDGAIDPATRQVHVIVRVPQPYVATADRAPLLVGTFTEVTIPGQTLDRYFDLPRASLREGDQVWTVVNGQLRMHPVTVVQEVNDRVLVTAPDLPDEVSLVVNNLPVVTDGMAVRLAAR